jgi:hypothetical protein
MKGHHLASDTYYLSDRLGEARTQSVAGRNKISLPCEPADAQRSTQCVAGSHSKGLPFRPAGRSQDAVLPLVLPDGRSP